MSHSGLGISFVTLHLAVSPLKESHLGPCRCCPLKTPPCPAVTKPAEGHLAHFACSSFNILPSWGNAPRVWSWGAMPHSPLQEMRGQVQGLCETQQGAHQEEALSLCRLQP